MSLSIQIPDANFSQFVGSLSLPDRSGLVAEYTFGVSEAQSVINRAAPGLAPMTPVGAAVYGSNYAEIRSGVTYGSVGFNTGIAPPENATLIVVVRKDTLFPGLLTSNLPGFAGFISNGNAPTLYNNQSGTSTSVANVPVPAHNDFAFFAGLMPLGGLGQIYVYEDGEVTVNTAEVAGGASRGTDPFKIGTTITSTGVGVADVAYIAIFERVLTALEIEAAYTSLKAYLGTRDVVVS